jgi:two-component system, NarL family, invasion response regulator UvrY
MPRDEERPSEPPVIRIAIADDHPAVRAGLRACLCGDPDFEVVAEASNGCEVVDLVRRIPVDVVILDIAMPKQNGLEALRSIKARSPQIAVLVLSGYPATLYAETVLRLGASGYLDKTCDPEDIVAAVRRASESRAVDELPVSPSASVDATCGDCSPQHVLNPRELQIFLRLAKGETIASIAKSLFLSAATVSVYRSRLIRKLELKSNSEITRNAVKHGLL